ncbi:TetR/AcrR family transcriptional regulator [Kribbella speibonae]|uniref:TetR/AcrR family transcriptional regulator n=1 Tax=Kribbella speibonae TaxID=1572660 RepID=A0A4R0IFX7_9ACTN|nr:TetR/AcrR family transcriptional regulator [Kribbella speibonae]TCC30954.1 TetR/AcrR family transcriptional regulator [Kribbella speibonae]
MAGETTPAVRGPYRRGIERRERIVSTASEVFGELGYVGGSLRNIAERVGASPATLIQYFGSKEGLLAAVLEDWTAQTGRSTLPDSTRGLAYFRQMRDLMEFHVHHRGLLELFITIAAEATNPSHPAREFIQQRYVNGLELWSGKLREAVEDGEIPALTDDQIEADIRILVAVLDGLELQWLLGADIDLPGLVATHVDQAITRWRTGPASPA